MISEQCYKSIFDQEVVSNEFVAIIGCMKDNIQIETLGISLHKLQIGLIVVAIDILSILFMSFVFGRLKPIIEEYLKIVDQNMIKISDFSIQIQDVELDEAMQDHRMIKMKLWVHLNNLIKHIKTDSKDPL